MVHRRETLHDFHDHVLSLDKASFSQYSFVHEIVAYLQLFRARVRLTYEQRFSMNDGCNSLMRKRL